MAKRTAYIPRELATKAHDLAGKYPVISVTGPRQSGKSTMLHHEFPDHDYVSLEDPDARAFAEEDPRGSSPRTQDPRSSTRSRGFPRFSRTYRESWTQTERPGVSFCRACRASY